MPRHRSKEARALPQALVRLLHSAKKHSADLEGSETTGAADALRDLGELALWALPIHGVFVPSNNRLDVVIEKIASDHLGLNEARREFGGALGAVELFERRDAIESAHNHVQAISDAAYYYAGLAFGITLTDFS